jgi:hypothetical protein
MSTRLPISRLEGPIFELTFRRAHSDADFQIPKEQHVICIQHNCRYYTLGLPKGFVYGVSQLRQQV